MLSNNKMKVSPYIREASIKIQHIFEGENEVLTIASSLSLSFSLFDQSWSENLSCDVPNRKCSD